MLQKGSKDSRSMFWLTPKEFPGRELIRRTGKKVLMNGRLFRPIMTDIIELWVAAIILLMTFNLLQLSQSENPNWKGVSLSWRRGRSITGPLPFGFSVEFRWNRNWCRKAATRLGPGPEPEEKSVFVTDFVSASTDFYIIKKYREFFLISRSKPGTPKFDFDRKLAFGRLLIELNLRRKKIRPAGYFPGHKNLVASILLSLLFATTGVGCTLQS